MSTDSYPNNERVPISGAVLGGSSMKISRIVDLHADAGWRVFSFLKIETDADSSAGRSTTRATAPKG